MAHVFLSYSKAHRALTVSLANDLEAAGYSVWWDTSLIPGDDFADVILKQLDAAHAAIVVWTPTSVKSRWVRSEARRADAAGKLIPVRSADLSEVDIPPPFDGLHTALVEDRDAIIAALKKLGVAPTGRQQARPYGAVSPSPEPTAVPKELAHWELIKESSDPKDFLAFLERFPSGAASALANTKLAQLETAAWAEARLTERPELISAFLAEYPGSRFQREAEARLAALRQRGEQHSTSTGPAAALTQGARNRLEQYIEAEEGALNRLSGWIGVGITAFAIAVSLFHLYAAFEIVPPHVLRPAHVGMVLALCYLLFPMARRFRDRIRWWDFVLAAGAAATMLYVLWQGGDFGDRATAPTQTDWLVGIVFVVLLLEATRRATGWIMPGVAIAFILYALFGNLLPHPWTHRGYAPEDLIAHLYMTLEGIFGTTVNVASTLIILFTIFGAVLAQSGAGRFFIDFSFAAMGGRRNAAGRAVVLSSFLLGGPSGSGVATTVTIGTVAYPLLAKAGYDKNAAGGLFAAGGLGAIISPPVLGAAAFLIAEYLRISYLDVIVMATIPTLLYYFSILVMVELDARKQGGAGEILVAKGEVWRLTKSYWFHFGSLISIIAFMLLGFSPELSVFWATVLAVAVSALRSDTAIVPWWAALPLVVALALVVSQLLGRPISTALAQYSWLLLAVPVMAVAALGVLAPRRFPVSQRFATAMQDGTTGVLNVAATCATAGIIVGVTTLTGLAQRFADIIIGYAQGSLLLTAIFTAGIVWIVGLAVPVTASYIMCAVIAAPAMIKLGVPAFAAHMFIFYYAVLSEVSPPTALSPFAASAITGGNPYLTTLQSWKYTMPAFLVPFVFVLDPQGIGLLLKVPADGSWLDIVQVFIETAAGIAMLAFAAQGWFLKRSTWLETALFATAGLFLVFPALLAALLQPLLGVDVGALVPGLSDLGVRVGYNLFLGLAAFAAAAAIQRLRSSATSALH